MNLKKIAVLVLGLGVVFNAFSAELEEVLNSFSVELECEGVLRGTKVDEVTVIVNRAQRKIYYGSDNAWFACNIYGLTQTFYNAGCPNEYMPEPKLTEDDWVTIYRKTLDFEIRSGKGEDLKVDVLKCKLSEAKI